MTALIAEASGKPFSFVELDEPVPRHWLEQAGLPAPIVGWSFGFREKFGQRGFNIVTGDIERLSGRKPRSLRELLAGAFAAG